MGKGRLTKKEVKELLDRRYQLLLRERHNREAMDDAAKAVYRLYSTEAARYRALDRIADFSARWQIDPRHTFAIYYLRPWMRKFGVLGRRYHAGLQRWVKEWVFPAEHPFYWFQWWLNKPMARASNG